MGGFGNREGHWLVVEPKGTSVMEVSQTDTHGRITARDTYESIRNVVRCMGIERLCEDGRGMVQFTADEAGLINRFGGNSQACLNWLEILLKEIPYMYGVAMHIGDFYRQQRGLFMPFLPGEVHA